MTKPAIPYVSGANPDPWSDMILKSVLRIFVLTGLLVLGCPALAQDTSSVEAGKPVARTAPGGASVLSVAQALYAVGVAQDDVVAVLSAARMAASVAVTTTEPAVLDPAKVTFEGEPPFPGKRAVPVAKPDAPAPPDGSTSRAVAKASFFSATSEEDGAADGPVTVDAMFAKAKELAAGNDALLDVIAGAMTEASPAQSGGAIGWKSRLPAGVTDVWAVPVYANTFAEVAVVGDGDANLDVVVTDEDGKILCYDSGWSDSLYCDFAPDRDGHLYVTVENVGRARNSYQLITN